MDHLVRILENVESEDETRIPFENPETDDDDCLLSSDESDLDDCLPSSDESDSDDDAFLERVCTGPYKKAKFVSEDCHMAAQACFGALTLDRVLESIRSEQEALATQSQVSGNRVTARRLPSRQPGKRWEPVSRILYKSCFNLLGEMANGECREQCPDLGEYFCEELLQVQNRQNLLIKSWQ